MKSKIILSLITSVMLVLNQFFLYPVYAQEYTVSGNGDGSTSQIEVKNDTSTEVNQGNEAEVNNDVKADSDTGGNEASGNNGDAQIITGDSEQSLVVENDINNNQAQIGCDCPDNSVAQIKDNGTDSTNQVAYTANTSTNISQNNTALINNNIVITASTGDNEASDNSGDVQLQTGDIRILAGVLTQANSSYISASSPNSAFNTKIAGNGSGSSNNVSSSFSGDQNFLINNYLELNNSIASFANTGGNKANNNGGKIFISTGSVLLDIILKTRANSSIIVADCDCNSPSPSSSPTPSPSSTPTPSSPPSGGGENNNGGSSGGSSSGGSGGGGSDSSASSGNGGEILGATLPATGGFSIYSATVFALALLLIGIMLRIDYAKAKNHFQLAYYRLFGGSFIYLFTYFKSLSMANKADSSPRYAFYFDP